MIRFIAVGLWVCLVAFGTLVLGVWMHGSQSQAGTTEENTAEKLQHVSHEQAHRMDVPVMVNGKVAGYVIAQLAYIVDSNARSQVSVPLGLFINDEIFRIFFGAYSDTSEIEKVKFDDVRQQIIDGVNQRFPEPVLKDILVEQFNFIRADQIRHPDRR